MRWKDSAAARHAAPGTLLKRSAARPVEMVPLIRVEAISSGDRGAAVPRRVRLRWNRAFRCVYIRSSYAAKMLLEGLHTPAPQRSVAYFTRVKSTPLAPTGGGATAALQYKIRKSPVNQPQQRDETQWVSSLL